MDPLGPSTAFKVRGATRGQGRAHGDQRTWWRGLRIADRRKTSTFRLLIQVTGLLVLQELGSTQCVLRVLWSPQWAIARRASVPIQSNDCNKAAREADR